MSDYDREKWNAKYGRGEDAASGPSAALVAIEHLLPREGKAIDVAGGAGRHAVWLARRGLDVTLADVSDAGLAIAERRASEAGVSIATRQIDLESEPLATIAEEWDLILTTLYLNRELLAGAAGSLAPGGRLVVLHPTKTNLTRHAKPPENFLLEDGELPSLVAPLEIVHYEEGWLEDGRHDARLVAEKP